MNKFEIGGWAPSNYRTTDGHVPEELRKYYKESESYNYQVRTKQNIMESDATLAIATDFRSLGEMFTRFECIRQAKLYEVFDLVKHRHNMTYLGNDSKAWYSYEYIEGFRSERHLAELQKIRDFLVEFKIKTLNVAGNSEKTVPGITRYVIDILKDLFRYDTLGVERIISGGQTGADQAATMFAILHNEAQDAQ